MKLNDEQRKALKNENKAYHHSRKWYNVEHIAMALWAVRRKLNEQARAN